MARPHLAVIRIVEGQVASLDVGYRKVYHVICYQKIAVDFLIQDGYRYCHGVIYLSSL